MALVCNFKACGCGRESFTIRVSRGKPGGVGVLRPAPGVPFIPLFDEYGGIVTVPVVLFIHVSFVVLFARLFSEFRRRSLRQFEVRQFRFRNFILGILRDFVARIEFVRDTESAIRRLAAHRLGGAWRMGYARRDGAFAGRPGD